MVFASGQVARDVDGQLVGLGDIRVQTRKTLENLRAVLAEGGATMDDVVKVTVFVTNLFRAISPPFTKLGASSSSRPTLPAHW